MHSSSEDSLTRAFVSGLPRNFTSQQLRSHFTDRYDITDAVVIPSRQIGFVGFRDHAEAKDAVNYFDKSYVRMSRISVSLAKPVEISRTGDGHPTPVSQRGSKHVSRPLAEDVGTKPETANGKSVSKSTEKRSVAEKVPESIRSNKRKRDEFHHDVQSTPNPRVSRQVIPGVLPKEDRSSPGAVDERKDHGATHEDHTELRSPSTQLQSADERAHDHSIELPPTDLHPAVKSGDKTSDPQRSNSDVDWLRGKTNRTLDLLGDDEKSPVPPDGQIDQLSAGAENIQDTNCGPEAEYDEQPGRPQVSNGRLFVRNLPFTSTEFDLNDIFSKHGRVAEVHVVKDFRTSSSKGLAYVQYVHFESAQKALQALDGLSFQGRLLHVLPASDKKNKTLGDFELAKLPIKKQKALKRKAEASTATFNWNSLYMNQDATLASVAADLGVEKSAILDATSSDAAVKQALAETEVIQKTKDSLRQSGVAVDAFENPTRDDQVILLKNFPFGTSSDELKGLLEPFGQVLRFTYPSTGTMAIAQFAESSQAQQALKQLAYRNVHGSVLYLEKAPAGLYANPLTGNAIRNRTSPEPQSLQQEQNQIQGDSPTVTLFVRNLNFATTSSRLAEIFRPLEGFLSARVKTRTDPKRPGQTLSMGFGFVEFRTELQAQTAMQAMTGFSLDGHDLQVQMSQRTVDVAEDQRQEDRAKKISMINTKIIIKNLPFEASKKDVRKLFGTYGQLRTVRVPKKFDSSSRGFAFAEFVTPKEAESAMKSLHNTHLLGRRLVLQYAVGESIDPEEEIRNLEAKTGRQSDMVRLSQITGSARRKFSAREGEDEAA